MTTSIGKDRPTEISVADIVAHLTKIGLRVHLVGSETTRIAGANTLEDAGEGDVTFLANRKYSKQIYETKASAIILPEAVSGPENLVQIKVDDSYFAFMQVVVLLYGYRRAPFEGIDASAKIAPSAKVGKHAHIGAGATICHDVVIGDNAVIYPGAFVGPNCTIGDHLTLYPNATVYDGCVIGSNVIIHSGSAIGTDGFGYATHQGVHHKIPQVGNVIIEDDVEIGSNCAVERATIGSTVIGRGSKLSDLVAIGHGTKIGAHCLLVAQVGVAGSVKMGHHVVLAGQVGVAGHISIGNCVQIGAKAGVMSNVDDNAVMLGQPAVPIQDAKRQVLLVSKLGDMKDQLKQLQKRVDQMEKK
jgi:UDP-3-O-[3-hydroxymyristoyl] glucosamine N-acyltransferase